jgi:hypothetical protein
MQKSGKHVAENMSELQDAVNVAANVALANSAVEEVRSTVAQLAKAAKHIESGDLHLALALVNDTRRANDLRAPPRCAALAPLCYPGMHMPSAHDARRGASSVRGDAWHVRTLPVTRVGPSLPGTEMRGVQARCLSLSLGACAVELYPVPAKDKHTQLAEMSKGEYDLLAVMIKAVQALLRAVRTHEKSTFHDWLAATRKAAAVVGERAIRRAAAERAHEDRLGQERKMLLGAPPLRRAPTRHACGGVRCVAAMERNVDACAGACGEAGLRLHLQGCSSRRRTSRRPRRWCCTSLRRRTPRLAAAPSSRTRLRARRRPSRCPTSRVRHPCPAPGGHACTCMHDTRHTAQLSRFSLSARSAVPAQEVWERHCTALLLRALHRHSAAPCAAPMQG